MKSGYGFSKTVSLPFKEAVVQITKALKDEGFGVLTEIDVTATLKKKLDVDFRDYVILGACNPPFAFEALKTELEIGLLLPCNVVVYSDNDGNSVVAALNPMVAMGVVDNPAMIEVAEQVTAKIKRALANIQ